MSDGLSNDHYRGFRYEKNLLIALKSLKKTHPIDLPLIEKAIECAKHYHNGQFRNSGEPYYSHPIAVAEILIDYCCNTNAIISAILHDVIEDTGIIEETIALLFNKDVLNKVIGLSVLRDNIKINKSKEIWTLYTHDEEVILIKLCDRLHNMRTIKYKNPPKQKLIALQTLEIFVPIANKLNYKKIQTELENICNQILLNKA